MDDSVTTENDTETIDFISKRMMRDHQTLAQVMDYWNSIREDERVPTRAHLDPRKIQNVLSNVFILDRTRPGIVRFRVAGHHLNELIGFEARGMPVRAFFDLTERRRLMEHVEICFTKPALLELDLISARDDQYPLTGRMIVLPMRDHEDKVTKALGALVTFGTSGNAPQRFLLRRQHLTPVTFPDYPEIRGQSKALDYCFCEGRVDTFDDGNKTTMFCFEETAVPYLKVVRQ